MKDCRRGQASGALRSSWERSLECGSQTAGTPRRIGESLRSTAREGRRWGSVVANGGMSGRAHRRASRPDDAASRQAGVALSLRTTRRRHKTDTSEGTRATSRDARRRTERADLQREVRHACTRVTPQTSMVRRGSTVRVRQRAIRWDVRQEASLEAPRPPTASWPGKRTLAYVDRAPAFRRATVFLWQRGHSASGCPARSLCQPGGSWLTCTAPCCVWMRPQRQTYRATT